MVKDSSSEATQKASDEITKLQSHVQQLNSSNNDLAKQIADLKTKLSTLEVISQDVTGLNLTGIE